MKLQPFTIETMIEPAKTPVPDSDTRRQYMIQRLGVVVRTLRKSRGHSIAELETLSGVSAATISRIENGDTEPGLCSLQGLERALEVKPGWLMSTAA